jgi:hypothetical protein
MCANIGNADPFDTLAIIRETALTGLANPPDGVAFGDNHAPKPPQVSGDGDVR